MAAPPRFLAIALVIAGCHSGLRTPGPPGTVVLVSVDTLRADRLGLYGSGRVLTPTIDGLGRESLVFDTAWSTVPLTLPAHASMLTGLYPPRHGVRANGVHRLDRDVPRLTTRFKEAGFRTGAFIGGFPLDRRFGLAEGFDRYDDELPVAASGFHYPERRAADVVGRALAWVGEQGRSARVFLFVHLYDPHAEYAAPEPFGARFADRPYDGEVAYVDSAVGRLREGLAAEDRWDQAVLVLVADHGESLGEHGEETHGLLLYEACLRVPFLLKAPEVVPGRAREPASLVDVAPTLLARAHLPPLEGVDGVDVSAKPRDPARELYAETLGPYLDHGWSGLRALRRRSLKLIEGPSPELFDIDGDPAEARNQWPSPEGESLQETLGRITARLGRRPSRAASLDPAAREALESLGYAASAGAVPDDFGAGRPDPRTRMDLVRELDAVSSLAAGSPETLRRLEALARRDPGSNLIRRRTAGARMAAKDYEGAIRDYREAGRLGYRGEDLPDALAEAHLRAGEQRAEGGDLVRARALLAEAARLRPGRAEVHHALGVVEARGGRLDRALRAFDEATKADAAFAPAWFSLGLAQERSGKAAEARASYRRFLDLQAEASPEREHALGFLEPR